MMRVYFEKPRTLVGWKSPVICATSGNGRCQRILRGGSVAGPNYKANAVTAAVGRLSEHSLVSGIVVHCSHADSDKDVRNQIKVCNHVANQIEAGSTVAGVMLGSHLKRGNQALISCAKDALVYAFSLTRKCLGLNDTLRRLERLAEANCARP